ncbi:hypothetical protein TUMEXPCC7403_14605 [Tumidithrix helvetica PCC 7403]|uniref:hypothetical protein n=1 Tax=Tumidithrix helvetica TaxID=3457545 RepID=UPI003C95A886
MTLNLFGNLKQALQWVQKTPERSVAEAYQAAVNIKKIEDEYFNGSEISNLAGYSENTFSLFQIQLNKYLSTIDVSLAAYKVSAKMPYCLPVSDVSQISKPLGNPNLDDNAPSLTQQLAFIDFMLSRYRLPTETNDIAIGNSSSIQLLDIKDELDSKSKKKGKFSLYPNNSQTNGKPPKKDDAVVPIENSILPGSFFKAFDRIKRNVSSSYSNYEQNIVDELRQSRRRINAALKYLAFLVITVLAVQFLSKSLVYSPLLDYWVGNQGTEIKFSASMQERAFNSFKAVKERLEFELLISKAVALSSPPKELEKPPANNSPSEKENPTINSGTNNEKEKPSTTSTAQKEQGNEKGKESVNAEEEFEKRLQQESLKILKEFNRSSWEGIKNLLADSTAGFVFYFIVISGRRQLRVIKDFFDETMYSLNDNAKAFLIIVSTDTFVGFHSSEGWDALLIVLFDHFGLPENKILTMAFISTVPVFLDGLFKFWIFQYLNQSSPSTAAIYSEMNE